MGGGAGVGCVRRTGVCLGNAAAGPIETGASATGAGGGHHHRSAHCPEIPIYMACSCHLPHLPQSGGAVQGGQV